MLLITTSIFQHPKTNMPSLYCQGSTLPGMLYVGKTTTTEHDLFHPNIFHQPSYNLQMYKEYILTNIIIPLIYLNDPYCNYFLFHIPGKQDHLTVNVHFQLNYLNGIYTEEVCLLKFKRNNNLPPWYPVFQIPYQIELKVSYTEHTASVQLIYIDTSPDPGIFSP